MSSLWYCCTQNLTTPCVVRNTPCGLYAHEHLRRQWQYVGTCHFLLCSAQTHIGNDGNGNMSLFAVQCTNIDR